MTPWGPCPLGCGIVLAVQQLTGSEVVLLELNKCQSPRGLGLVAASAAASWGGRCPCLPPVFWFSPEHAIFAKEGKVTEFQGSTLVAVLTFLFLTVIFFPGSCNCADEEKRALGNFFMVTLCNDIWDVVKSCLPSPPTPSKGFPVGQGSWRGSEGLSSLETALDLLRGHFAGGTFQGAPIGTAGNPS